MTIKQRHLLRMSLGKPNKAEPPPASSADIFCYTAAAGLLLWNLFIFAILLLPLD